ncbi:hypothetical protein JCM3770_005174 [Rhodotorula araucariae]
MYPNHALPQSGQQFDPAQYAASGSFVPPPPLRAGSALAQHAAPGSYASPAQSHPQAAYLNSAYAQQQQQQQQQQQAAAAQMNSTMFGAAPPGSATPGQHQPQQWQQANAQQQYAQQGMYSTAGGAYAGMSQAPSTASLFQQQLAQQQAMSTASPGQHTQQPNYQNSAQSQQAYAQQAYAQQQAQAQARASQPPPPAQPSYPTQPPAPQQAASPYAQPTRPAGQPSSMQELQAVLRGVNLQGMTSERFAQLTPAQQAAVREFLTRSRQAQQAQLGLGMPGANASPVASGSAPSPAARPSTGQGQPGQSQGQFNGAQSQQQAQRPSPAPGTPVQGQAGPYSQQNAVFLKSLAEFYNKKGVAFSGAPIVDGQPLDVARTFAAVTQAGGFNGVTNGRKWGLIASGLGYPAAAPDQHPEQRLQALMQGYQQVLYPFEQYWVHMQQARLAQQRGQPIPPAPVFGNSSAPSPAATAFTQPSAPPTAAPSTPQSQSQPTRPPTATTRPASRAAGPATPAPVAAPSPFAGSMPPPEAPSPFAMGATRPNTAGEDVKGKAKAEDAFGTVKTEETSFALPSAPSAGPFAAAAVSPAKPAEPVVPPRRKRRRIEYAPLARPLDTHGGHDLALVEAIHHRLDKLRPRRTVRDLGTVDVHGLVMGLRSRLASEVSFALNALATIAMASQQDLQTLRVAFRLRENPELVEELLDLLEETAFGVDGEGEVEDEAEKLPQRRGATPAPNTYRALFRLVEDEASALAPPPSPPPPLDPLEDGGSSLRPAETVLAVANLVRTFAFDPDNAHFLRQDGRAAALLVRAASLPLKRARVPGASASRWPVRVTAADSMALKKAALETLAAFGTSVQLDAWPTATAQKTLDLLLFFIREPHSHREPWAFDLSNTPGMAARLAQVHAYAPQSNSIPPYLDLGLSTFARVVLPDANRSVVARLLDGDELHALFDALVRLLPVAEADFQLLTFEVGIVHVHNAIMTLYNLAFLAPAGVKARLRADPKVVKSLLRVVRRLAGTLSLSHDAEIWQGIADRCIAILRLLDDVDRPVGGAKAAQQGPNADLPWWGMSMSGLDDDEEPASSAPSDAGGGIGALAGVDEDAAGPEADVAAAAVDALARPAASGPASRAAVAAAAPILAGEVRALFEHVQMGSLQLVIPALAQMADGTRGGGGLGERTKKRRAG